MKLTKITLPLLKPTTLFLLTTETISSFQVFTPVNVMTDGGPGYATTTLISLLYDNGGYQALKNAKHPRFFAPASIAVTGAEDKERAPTRFSDLAQARFGGDSIVYPMSELDEATLAAIREDDYDVAVLAVYNARFRPSQQTILRELEKQNRPLVVLMLGAPYDAPLIRNAQCVICAYEYTYLAAQELLNCLETGEFKGHLPVKLPEMTFEP